MLRGYAETSHGQIHFRKAGDEGPIVVLLHQTASSSRMYEPMMEALSPWFQIFALDTPGFGQSDAHPNQPTIADLARTLREACHSLGLERLHLLGHHTGAAIATQWAVDDPDQVLSLTMVGPLAMGSEERQRWSQQIQPAQIAEDGSHLIEAWNRVANIDQQPVVFPPQTELRHREAVDQLLAAPRWPEAYQAVFSFDFEAALRQVVCPQLLLCGDEDILFPYLEATVNLMRNPRVHKFSGGAYILEQQTLEVAPIVIDFLSSDSTQLTLT